MSRDYVTKAGDTLSKVSFLFYGTDAQASVIQSANPSITNPNTLIAGKLILIPDIPGITDKIEAPAAALVGGEKDEVSLTIEGEQFTLWERVSINQSMDTIADTFEFSGPWNPDNPDSRKIFKPYSYKQMAIHIGGEKILTGVIVVHTPESLPNSSMLGLAGYSKPGILADVNPPPSIYPIEFKDVDLKQITNALLQPYSVKAVFSADQGAAFKQVTMEPTDTIYGFLTKLAKQRGLILASNSEGELLFQKATTEASKISLIDGLYPVTGGDTRYDGQTRYSSISALGDGWEEGEGQTSTIDDPTIETARHRSFQATDIAPGDLRDAAIAELGRSIATSIIINVPITGWRDKKGNLLKANQTVTYQSNKLMIYNETEFIIRNIMYNKNPSGLTANLSLVFPEVYSGEIRTSYPWDG